MNSLTRLLTTCILAVSVFATTGLYSSSSVIVVPPDKGVEIFPVPGTNLNPGFTEVDGKIQFFDEGRKTTTGTMVDLRISDIGPGMYTVDAVADRRVGSLTGTFDSWYFHYDTTGPQLDTIENVAFTFDQPIAGVIFSDDKTIWSGDNFLFDSISDFGLTGVTYPDRLNGPNLDSPLPLFDSFQISADRRTLTIVKFNVSSGVDQMRVLLTPEPSTYLVLGGTLLFALVMYQRKRKVAVKVKLDK